MSATQPPQDPYLNLPLSGLRLIEASAGTGKTFTLATLFTRLVVERGLRMGQILAVTFTDAATQELRKRIRERLDLAARLVNAEPSAADNPETTLTHAILRRHLAQGEESAAQLARRLRIAAEETDLAAIFTIHGFCTRVLGEHALESGHSFAAPELLTNARQLHAELAAELWRQHATRARLHHPGQQRLWRVHPRCAVVQRPGRMCSGLLGHLDVRGPQLRQRLLIRPSQHHRYLQPGQAGARVAGHDAGQRCLWPARHCQGL